MEGQWTWWGIKFSINRIWKRGSNIIQSIVGYFSHFYSTARFWNKQTSLLLWREDCFYNSAMRFYFVTSFQWTDIFANRSMFSFFMVCFAVETFELFFLEWLEWQLCKSFQACALDSCYSALNWFVNPAFDIAHGRIWGHNKPASIFLLLIKWCNRQVVDSAVAAGDLTCYRENHSFLFIAPTIWIDIHFVVNSFIVWIRNLAIRFRLIYSYKGKAIAKGDME